MRVLGMLGNSVTGLSASEAMLPISDSGEAMSNYELLYCFRRDSNKVQNYLKILKCRIEKRHGPLTCTNGQHNGHMLVHTYQACLTLRQLRPHHIPDFLHRFIL
ncbi:hypothetical protein M9458_009671 [Cirrhinus mrigala]|uniref:Uncharacterized protein n=1 Tax=Cirrhinus mrigala TaxID=683832 RepID=A0ABD0RC40_CIRMR